MVEEELAVQIDTEKAGVARHIYDLSVDDDARLETCFKGAVEKKEHSLLSGFRCSFHFRLHSITMSTAA